MATQSITDNVSSLLLNEEYSDLQIVVGDVTFPAHKNIVCPRSGYFQRAVRNFREASGRVEFEDKDPFIIRKILEYLYKGSYEVVPSQGIAEIEPSLAESALNGPRPAAIFGTDTAYFHALMHAEADYFVIEDLKSETKKRFSACLPAPDFFKSSPPDCSGEKSSFVAMVTELYSSNANYHDLRGPLVQYVLDNLSSFRDSTSALHTLEDSFLQDLPDFTFDLCRAMLDQGFRPPARATSSHPKRMHAATSARSSLFAGIIDTQRRLSFTSSSSSGSF